MNATTSIAHYDLLAFIDHEVRNSATIIAGNSLSLLLRDNAAQSDGEGVAYNCGAGALIEQEARNLASLVTTLASLSGNDDAWLPKPTLVQLLLPKIISRLAPTYSGREVFFDAPRHLVAAQTSECLLEIVMKNLLSNAHKYSEPADPIVVRARLEDSGVVIAVSNTGRVRPDELERIFDLTYRSDAVAGKEGSGVGLAECRSLVRLMGGSIRASSPDDGGFEVRLTLLTPEDPEVDLGLGGILAPGLAPSAADGCRRTLTSLIPDPADRHRRRGMVACLNYCSALRWS